MDIDFRTKKLKRVCNSISLARRAYGVEKGEYLMRRLGQIKYSDNLAVLMTLPQARCHQLKGNRRGQFSVDLKHPFRLILEPAVDPLPKLKDGGLDLQRITNMRILAVEDTHG